VVSNVQNWIAEVCCVQLVPSFLFRTIGREGGEEKEGEELILMERRKKQKKKEARGRRDNQSTA
jgi:hypothetical protein